MSTQETEELEIKVCGVCGDIALGYNFNAITCESCKAFFRRNALKVKEFHCPFTKQCILTPVTRRFCQKCRLDKCFAIGMKKELILSSEDKKKKRRKIESNRVKKHELSGGPKNFEPLPNAASSQDGPCIRIPDFMDSTLFKAIEIEFKTYPVLAVTDSVSSQLNTNEFAKLNELVSANKGFFAPISNIGTLLVGDITDIITLTAVAIRRLIKMSKRINAFKNLCQEDQVALLKGGCTELMILRSVMSYDSTRNTWKIPYSLQEIDVNIKMDLLKEAKDNIYEEHRQFLNSFDEEWRTDENVMLLLSAITLFSPERSKLIHVDVIKLEQNSYYYLLRRYLESVYPGCKARSTFLKLIQKVEELHRINEKQMKFFLDLNPHDIEPLLIEIFDLKTH